jgi:hypothetical protein
VFDQTEQAQAAGSQRPLTELFVGESVQLPENDLSFLVEEGEKELFLGADEQSGHRESLPPVRFRAEQSCPEP